MKKSKADILRLLIEEFIRCATKQQKDIMIGMLEGILWNIKKE